MKKLTIITAGLLPVPAVAGGAVESLCELIVKENEKNKKADISLITVADERINLKSYENTKIYQVKKPGIISLIDRFIDKASKLISFIHSSGRVYDLLLASCYRKIETDIAIVENVGSLACLIAKHNSKKNIATYFHIHNDIDLYRSKEEIDYLVDKKVVFLAVSGYIKDQILKCNKNADVRVLYNGLDMDMFAVKEENSNELVRSMLHLEDDESVYMVSGRFIADKGILEAMQAFKQLTKKVDNKSAKLRMLVVGASDFAGKYVTDYAKKIYDLYEDNKDIFILKGYTPSYIMSLYYDMADVIIIPSLWQEPFGMVALEAMAKEKAIIATRSGGLREILSDKTAIMVDMDDYKNANQEFINRLSLAMSQFTDEGRRIEYAKRARQEFMARETFHQEGYFDSLMEIITPRAEGLISVIIPVYNVKDYLKRCLESVLASTYKKLEIILVDDGSTDGSGEICDSFLATDDRIKVIHKENGGLSSARNAGLKKAKGDYVFFIDSDDYINEDTLEIMINTSIEKNADIVACGIKFSYEDERLDKPMTDGDYFEANSSEALLHMMKEASICSVAWNKLYKRELFKDIIFPVGKYHEDEFTTYRLLMRAKKICFIPKLCYNYWQRAGSIMNNMKQGIYMDKLLALEERTEYMWENNEKKLAELSHYEYLTYIKYIYRNLCDREKKRGLKDLYRTKAKGVLFYRHLTFRERLSVLGWGIRGVIDE